MIIVNLEVGAGVSAIVTTIFGESAISVKTSSLMGIVGYRVGPKTAPNVNLTIFGIRDVNPFWLNPVKQGRYL